MKKINFTPIIKLIYKYDISEYLAIIINLFLAISEFLKKNYSAAIAFMGICLFIIIIIIKNKIIKNYQLLISQYKIALHEYHQLMNDILDLKKEKNDNSK